MVFLCDFHMEMGIAPPVCMQVPCRRGRSRLSGVPINIWMKSGTVAYGSGMCVVLGF